MKKFFAIFVLSCLLLGIPMMSVCAVNSTPLELPFTDNLDKKLAEEWTVVVGTPIFIDGKLTSASDNLRLEIGDKSLTQYVLEMDVWGQDKDYCGFGYSKYLIVNFSTKLQLKFGYTDYNGRMKWELFTDDKWKSIADYDGLKCGRFKIVVDDSDYQVFIQGQLVSELSAIPAEGPLSISLDESVTLDNIHIRALD